MNSEIWTEQSISDIAKKLQTCSQCQTRRKSHNGEYCLPSSRAIHDVLDSMIAILFPGCHGCPVVADMASLEQHLKSIANTLQEQATTAFEYQCELKECTDNCNCGEQAEKAISHLMTMLPEIQNQLQEDIQAAFDGDPSAKSQMEVVMSYPAIQAITTYRIAHALYEMHVPLIPRVMSELAHSRTGIDIHPGATIGRSFFIDHGTGVVIGETSVIGNNVKIYQGVTLGALSFPRREDGTIIKGIKRHPNVGDNVTIYAEATILGDTSIGNGSVIGGNVWLTHSVPPKSRVNNNQPGPEVK